MPLSPAQDDYRNQIADAMMPSRADKTPLAQGMAALPANMMQQFTPQSIAAGPPGMPQTPAGGVPGSGLAPPAPSTVQLPPQSIGMRGAMPAMGTRQIGVDQYGMMPPRGRRGY